MAYIIIGALVGAIVGTLIESKKSNEQYKDVSCISKCVKVHDENGENYPWLDNYKGGLNHIEYEEPIGTGAWRRYNSKIWEAHCKVVNHSPDQLVTSHLKSFMYPGRFARLKFIFNKGEDLITDIENEDKFKYIYELEAKYFESNKLCM